MKKKTKRYCLNKEMSDPDWIHRKQQDYFALKNAFQRFEWGSAYIPQACFDAYNVIRLEIVRMDEPMKAWKADKPKWIKRKIRAEEHDFAIAKSRRLASLQPVSQASGINLGREGL